MGDAADLWGDALVPLVAPCCLSSPRHRGELPRVMRERSAPAHVGWQASRSRDPDRRYTKARLYVPGPPVPVQGHAGLCARPPLGSGAAPRPEFDAAAKDLNECSDATVQASGRSARSSSNPGLESDDTLAS